MKEGETVQKPINKIQPKTLGKTVQKPIAKKVMQKPIAKTQPKNPANILKNPAIKTPGIHKKSPINPWIILGIIIGILIIAGVSYFLIYNEDNDNNLEDAGDNPGGITDLQEGINDIQEEIPIIECAEEGEAPLYSESGELIGECCEGLKIVAGFSVPDKEEYSCAEAIPDYTFSTCSNCGNGICETWENKCNCVKDCDPENANLRICGDGKCDDREICPEDCN